LTQALQRLAGDGAGSPVIDLQTSFGGGKTHSMIALYHLFCGRQPHEFTQEVHELVRGIGLNALPAVTRAVVTGRVVCTWFGGIER
jgi:hypothetical protein